MSVVGVSTDSATPRRRTPTSPPQSQTSENTADTRSCIAYSIHLSRMGKGGKSYFMKEKKTLTRTGPTVQSNQRGFSWEYAVPSRTAWMVVCWLYSAPCGTQECILICPNCPCIVLPILGIMKKKTG